MYHMYKEVCDDTALCSHDTQMIMQPSHHRIQAARVFFTKYHTRGLSVEAERKYVLIQRAPLTMWPIITLDKTKMADTCGFFQKFLVLKSSEQKHFGLKQKEKN